MVELETTAQKLMRTTHGWISLLAILARVTSVVKTAMKKPSQITSKTVSSKDDPDDVPTLKITAGKNLIKRLAAKPNLVHP
mmetsp:Transcript_22680/g.34600  ORF Transcript_22680/g.34600 Transcript_22680/m.34600 type:complete len:81 (+) Transcript_22680:514-756(+)